MREAPPDRRRRYRASLLSGDYFIVRGLAGFLERAIRETVASGDRVVDVGCGEQPLRGAVEGRGGAYTGVDVAQNALGTVDVVASAASVPLPDASFDVVLCTEVLEHVPDPGAALRELLRLARPGGRVVVTVPFVYRLHEEPHDYSRVTEHQLRSWADAAGAHVTEIRTLGDEAQVLATVWAGAWETCGEPRAALPRRVWRALRKVPILLGNVGAAVVGAVIGRALPRKYHLSVVAVLEKAGPDAGPERGRP